MLSRIKVMDIDLDRPLADIEGLDGYAALQGLVRLHYTPIGYVKIAVTGGRCTAATLRRAIVEQHHRTIISHLLADGFGAATRWSRRHRLAQCLTSRVQWTFSGSDRGGVYARSAAQLVGCLDALCRLDYPALDLVVVDNAPRDTTTARLVHGRYPQLRYVCEPRPGLNWARNRAIAEARGEIIAYTDDDVVVDRGWVRALAQVFAEEPEVMAVTGLVVPLELETEAQCLFERYGGFGRGFQRQWYRVDRQSGECAATRHGGAGKFGTGANMAYRHSLFDAHRRLRSGAGCGHRYQWGRRPRNVLPRVAGRPYAGV